MEVRLSWSASAGWAWLAALGHDGSKYDLFVGVIHLVEEFLGSWGELVPVGTVHSGIVGLRLFSY